MAVTNHRFISKISKIELIGCTLDMVIMTSLEGLLHNAEEHMQTGSSCPEAVGWVSGHYKKKPFVLITSIALRIFS